MFTLCHIPMLISRAAFCVGCISLVRQPLRQTLPRLPFQVTDCFLFRNWRKPTPSAMKKKMLMSPFIGETSQSVPGMIWMWCSVKSWLRKASSTMCIRTPGQIELVKRRISPYTIAQEIIAAIAKGMKAAKYNVVKFGRTARSRKNR